MPRLSSCRRSRWSWVLAAAMLLGQWVGSHAAFAHHARSLLATASPTWQVCSVRAAPGAVPADARTGQGDDGHAAALSPCCAACGALSIAPPPLWQALAQQAPADVGRRPTSDRPAAHGLAVTLPQARAPPQQA